MDPATLTQIGVKTIKKSKGFLLMNRVIHRLTKNTYAIILSVLMDSEESSYKKLIFHKLQCNLLYNFSQHVGLFECEFFSSLRPQRS